MNNDKYQKKIKQSLRNLFANTNVEIFYEELAEDGHVSINNIITEKCIALYVWIFFLSIDR